MNSPSERPQNGQRNLHNAQIKWHKGVPISLAFNQPYYPLNNALSLNRQQFLTANNLLSRWKNLVTGTPFTLMEIGFGSGLNFLATVQLWLKTAPQKNFLHYVAVEKYPLTPEDLSQALNHWPELEPLCHEFINQYPAPVCGFHRCWLFDKRVCLTLIFDDAHTGLEQLTSCDHPDFLFDSNPVADAWFLDGFSTDKNPELWSPALFNIINRLSKATTTLSTSNSDRKVISDLQNAGFTIASVTSESNPDLKTYKKSGRCEPATKTPAETHTTSPRKANNRIESPWYLKQSTDSFTHRNHAVVIGNGIAGCSSAAALIKRGWRVTLIDKSPQLASAASGNPQGILYPKLSVEDLAISLFVRHAICHAAAFYQDIWAQKNIGTACGVLVLPQSSREEKHLPQIASRYANAQNLVKLVDQDSIKKLCGTTLTAKSGLYFPQLGWVKPPAVCNYLAAQIPQITATVEKLNYDSRYQCWQIIDNHGQLISTAPVVVIANSYHAQHFSQTAQLPLKKIRGQITALPVTPQSARLKTVICGAGYLAPADNGIHTLGATYNPDSTDTKSRAIDHQANMQTLLQTDPALPRLFSEQPVDYGHMDGRAGIRCATPDYLPIAGPAPKVDDFVHLYAELGHNARACIPQSGSYWPGLWLNCGHGSRGLTYAPLTAELIASQINAEPLPLPRNLVTALNPGRFIIRNLKKHKKQ